MSEQPDRPDPSDVPDYGLETDDANVELHGVVDAVRSGVERGEYERAEALSVLSDGVRELSREHPSVTDITARDAVLRELDPTFERAGWPKLDPFEF